MRGRRSGDNSNVKTVFNFRQAKADNMPQTPPYFVPDDGFFGNFRGDRYPEAAFRQIIFRRFQRQKNSSQITAGFENRFKIFLFPQTIYFRQHANFAAKFKESPLNRQLFPSFGAAAGNDATTAFRSHSFQKTVLSLPFSFFRLICYGHNYYDNADNKRRLAEIIEKYKFLSYTSKMKKKVAGIIILSLILIAAVSAAYFYRVRISDYWYELKKQPLPKPITIDDIIVPPRKEINNSRQIPLEPAVASDLPLTGQATGGAPEETTEFPKEINLAVPFTTQAPSADWNLPYKETCEEASLIMVNYFLKNQGLTPSLADREILNLIGYQKQKLGYFEDTDAETTAQIMRDYYGHKGAKAVYGITINDIKKEVAKGRPVIVPAAGRLLGNPFFAFPGPLYHMLVIKGYTEENFITNDPGTRRGENFLYPFDRLFNAVHDWNGGDVYNGRKAMIVVYPENQIVPFVSINGKKIAVEIAKTPAEQATGLGFRDSLGKDDGMLFVFEKKTTPGFWMKNMKFPIDIVWISGGAVVAVSENIQPPADMTKENLPVYSPPVPVNYVLEVNAGFAAKNGIKTGNKVNFSDLQK